MMKGVKIKNSKGDIISLKQLRRENKENFLIDKSAKIDLISSGLFTAKELRNPNEKKKFKEIKFRGKIYYTKTEITDYVIDSARQRKLF